ncbi:MAG TPA: hypothetical protein VIF37_03635 [Methylobacter sp.]
MKSTLNLILARIVPNGIFYVQLIGYSASPRQLLVHCSTSCIRAVVKRLQLVVCWRETALRSTAFGRSKTIGRI